MFIENKFILLRFDIENIESNENIGDIKMAVNNNHNLSMQNVIISDDNTNLLQRISNKKAALDKKRPLTQGELERLNEEFLIDFTYNSNAIEGNTLTLRETSLVLQGVTIDQKPLKDHLEAVGHRDAFLYVLDIATNNITISQSVIKDIHSLVLINRPNDKGIYRRIPVQIMGAYCEPVAPHFIEEKLTELLADNHQQNMHPVVRVALFHILFEGIHPFIDGNGRTGRLLLNLDLIQSGFPPINVKFSDRQRYYDAFGSCYRDDDKNAMIKLIGDAVEERLDVYLSFAE